MATATAGAWPSCDHDQGLDQRAQVKHELRKSPCILRERDEVDIDFIRAHVGDSIRDPTQRKPMLASDLDLTETGYKELTVREVS